MSCIAAHPATKLAESDRALVGVVESRTAIGTPAGGSAGWEYVVRVERTLEGRRGRAGHAAQRRSPRARSRSRSASGSAWPTSAPISRSTRAATSTPTSCSRRARCPRRAGRPSSPPSSMAFPAPTPCCSARAARSAGYGFPRGEVLGARRRCTSGGGVAEAVRDADGKIRVGSTEVPVRDVLAVGCTENGRRYWAVGRSGADTVLLTVRNGQVEERMRASRGRGHDRRLARLLRPRRRPRADRPAHRREAALRAHRRASSRRSPATATASPGACATVAPPCSNVAHRQAGHAAPTAAG